MARFVFIIVLDTRAVATATEQYKCTTEFILRVFFHAAFHATPNVYKRKNKEIHIETEPCGENCFLLQVGLD